ncbi:uncharacterized protein ZBAI_08108 [Zygosaccharomyces bailii ISA1307]|nr:uncharacterized protein ZBAI_08108 [Zygosaccharomyces bailii ISA1307]
MLLSKLKSSVILPGALRCIRNRSFYSSKNGSSDDVEEAEAEDAIEESSSFSSLQYSSQEDKQKLRTRGKKLKPIKTNIVVLDPRQAGLLRKRKTPNYFKKSQEKLSILEGVELGVESLANQPPNGTRLRQAKQSKPSSPSKILQEIEAQRKRLLVFKSSVSKEQAVRSIDHQKPLTRMMSKRRYGQLKQLLDSAYTLPQLKAYTKKYYGIAHSRTTKTDLIATLMNDYWKCEVNDSMDEAEDLILERIINIDTRDMYLLLLTNNGKILNNFSRIGATLAVALDENVMIVRATAAIIKYVEVSLTNILANVNTTMMPVRQFIQDHSARNEVMPDKKFRELISLIQRESAVYFELSSLETEANEEVYRISGFGRKRVSKAQNLLLWGIQYCPQLTQKVEISSNEDLKSSRKFPFTDIECLDWINKNKQWYRLQVPVSKIRSKPKSETSVKSRITDQKIDEWYTFLVEENRKSGTHMMPLELSKRPKHIFSMTLGQILTARETEDNPEQTLFEPRIPHITTKLLELPLYDSLENEEDMGTVDQHDYYVQLNFIPDLSQLADAKENAPPIELWFELDEYDNAIVSSARCLAQLKQRNLFLQAPQQFRDLKVSLDTVAELTKTFDEDQENWLSHQPGIRQFLEQAHLTFHSKKGLVIPKSMNLSLPRTHGTVNVQYDYVNSTYHRILRLRYKNKYLVQFSDVKGGSSGGNHTQVDFIGGETLSREDFRQFVRDVSEFV